MQNYFVPHFPLNSLVHCSFSFFCVSFFFRIYPQLPPQKSVIVTYVLWLFGGIFGAHHLYLGNDLQAFIWWTTLGGYFGMGWIGEAFRIPEMVREANEDPGFVERFVYQLRTTPKPPFSTSRFLFAIMVGYLWAQLFMVAIPQDKFAGIDWSYLHWLVPFIGALGMRLAFCCFSPLRPSHLTCISISGIYMVGNLGREKGVFWHCLIAAYITYPIRYIIYDESYWLSITLVVSALAFDHWSKEFDRQPRKRRSLKKRFFLLSTGLCIYLSVWLAFFYFNGKVSDGEGDEIPVHEAITNFFASSWWTDIKQTVSDIYTYAQHHGWYEIYKQIIESLDVDGEQKAYKVRLNV